MYWVESNYLDLKKAYQCFSYESLTNEGTVTFQQQDLQEIELKQPGGEESYNPYEGISQNTYLYVQEKSIIQTDINNICTYFNHVYVQKNPKFTEQQIKKFPFAKIKDRICFIIQKYQEQPALLDSIMESLITPIMQQVRDFLLWLMKIFIDNEKALENQQIVPVEFHDIVAIIYLLCKVRNYKYINKYFPHEVKDIEPVIFYLVSQRNNQANFWETKYVLLLWMSIIILVPFDLITIDSKFIKFTNQSDKSIAQECENNDICSNIIELGKFYLKTSSKMRDAGSLFLANFFARPDVQKMNLLKGYITWASETIQQIKNESTHICGILTSLIEIFKIGQRKDLLPHIHQLITVVRSNEEKEKQTNQTVLRHLKVKLTQRIGLVYLKPRAVTWAYKRGNKSLIDNIKSTITDSKLKSNVDKITQRKSNQQQQTNSEHFEEHNNYDNYFDDINQEDLENILDFLIENLSDKDTIVRWSAAKGIGRITGRLDLDMADDIVSAVIELFSINATDSTWHGGCLTIGELSRRGLLLPNRLAEFFPILNKALHLDINQGNYSQGSNVRDSACYVAWAFARAYDPEVLKPYVAELSKNLLITCIYDREVNCRRAASAAFQEHVGRQGSFPHGIEILTEADYFTIGLRSNAYLNVGLYASSYDQYFQSAVEHLAFIKLRHWDTDIRRVSAAALALMSCLNPKFMVFDILRGLIAKCYSDNVNDRHGAIYGICEIICGLNGKGHMHNMKDDMKDSVFLKTMTKNERKLIKAGEYMTKFKEQYEKLRFINNIQLIDNQLLDDILDIVNQIEKRRLFRGKGGEVMRIAVCRFIEGISIAKLPLKADHIKRFTETLDECLKSCLDLIQTAAVKSFQIFSSAYHTEPKKEYQLYVSKLLKSASSDSNVAITRGYTRGLTSLSAPLLKVNLQEVLKICNENSKIKQKESDDAETRKYAIQGLQTIIECLGLEDGQITQEIFEQIFDLCFFVMNDYTMDKRGDIGSIVRECSMCVMCAILRVYISHKRKGITKIEIKSKTIYFFIRILLQQLAEKIDRVRLVAGSVLQEIIDSFNDVLPDYPHKSMISKALNKESIKEIVQKDQQKFDATFETSVIQAELQYFLLEKSGCESDEYVYYWNVPHATYPIIVPLLDLEEYNYHLLKGLCVSVGGISESVVKFSLNALTEYISQCNKKQNKDELFKRIFENSIIILNEYAKDERVIVPYFKMLDFILERNEIQLWNGCQQFARILFDIIIKETKSTKSILKLQAAIGLVVGLVNLRNKEIEKDLLILISQLQIHKFPKVRKLMADKFYLMLLASGEEYYGNELSDQCIEFLMGTDWLDENLNIKYAQNTFNKLFGLQVESSNQQQQTN